MVEIWLGTVLGTATSGMGIVPDTLALGNCLKAGKSVREGVMSGSKARTGGSRCTNSARISCSRYRNSARINCSRYRNSARISCYRNNNSTRHAASGAGIVQKLLASSVGITIGVMPPVMGTVPGLVGIGMTDPVMGRGTCARCASDARNSVIRLGNTVNDNDTNYYKNAKVSGFNK